MNIQIFGSKKSNDSKKAERWFKERRIKYQMIDMKEKGMSRGELTSVMQAVGGLDALLDPNAKDKDTLALLRYLTDDAKLEKVLENPQLLRTPVVRNGKKATVGYAPEVWDTWE
ncbi:MAG: arsenate reductase family protein [Oscillospiraceae bacterium]|nr:arsenate reductase family protein [Oscillospiraceae bacterium]